MANEGEAVRSEARTQVRTLLPREHGAWAQFFLPLATGLLLAGGEGAAWLLALGAAAVFFVHEPVLVLVGRRGGRAKAEAGVRARRWVAGLSLAGIVAGGAGLWLAPDPARITAFGVLGLGAAVALLVALDREKTTGGELLAAVTLSSVGLVVALAGGVDPVSAWTVAGVWVGVFVPATFAVRAVVAQSKRRASWVLKVGAIVTGVGAVVLAWRSGTAVSNEAALFLLVGAMPSVGLALVPPQAKRLRQVGWTLAAACALVSVFAIRVWLGG